MANGSTLLEPVWTAYLVTRDCFRVTRRALLHSDPGVFNGTSLLSPHDATAAESRIEESQARADELGYDQLYCGHF